MDAEGLGSPSSRLFIYAAILLISLIASRGSRRPLLIPQAAASPLSMKCLPAFLPAYLNPKLQRQPSHMPASRFYSSTSQSVPSPFLSFTAILLAPSFAPCPYQYALAYYTASLLYHQTQVIILSLYRTHASTTFLPACPAHVRPLLLKKRPSSVNLNTLAKSTLSVLPFFSLPCILP